MQIKKGKTADEKGDQTKIQRSLPFMFKIVRFPKKLNNFFNFLQSEFRFSHFEYFRALVLLIAAAWDDHNISSLCRYLDERYFHHRTRFNNFMNKVRGNLPQALAAVAYKLLASLSLKEGQTVLFTIDDSKKDKRGKKMEAAGWVYDPITGKSMWGHQYVKATISVNGITIPFGIRLYAKDTECKKLGRPFLKVTELAAELIKSFNPPKGVNVLVLFDSYYLCPVVVNACRQKGFHFVSTLKSNRNLKNRGKKVKAGSYGKYCFKTRKKSRIKISKDHRTAIYHYVDAGFVEVSKLGTAHVVFSRKNSERKVLGIVTSHPKLNAAQMIASYNVRWQIEVFFKNAKQLLGLGRYQHRSYKAAVTHLHLVCFAYALLTHIAISGTCEKEIKRKKAHASVKELQNTLRRIIWEDTAQYLKEFPDENSVFKELNRLLVAA